MTISASANNFLSWQNYKNFIQWCHVWWMWIRIMARNGHQRALNQLKTCFFAYFISGTALICPLDWGNIWFARIPQLSTDFWYLLYMKQKHADQFNKGFPLTVFASRTWSGSGMAPHNLSQAHNARRCHVSTLGKCVQHLRFAQHGMLAHISAGWINCKISYVIQYTMLG